MFVKVTVPKDGKALLEHNGKVVVYIDLYLEDSLQGRI